MRILTIDGYLYKIGLGKDPEITEIVSDDDDGQELVHHYGLYYNYMIVVHLDEGAEFLKAEVFDKNMRPKNLINEPEEQVNYKKFPFKIQGK